MTETRHEQLRQEATAFHRKHPEVWEMFVRLTTSRIARGFEHYSARAIFHQIRWEKEQPTYEAGEEFKLNDHHTPFYARRFMRLYPHHEGFFRTRIQKSHDVEASNRPPLGPGDFPTWPQSVAPQQS